MLIELSHARIECIKVETEALPRASFHLGMRQQPASDTLLAPARLDPKMTDVAPSPMGDAVEPTDECISVISENRKRQLVPWTEARRNLNA